MERLEHGDNYGETLDKSRLISEYILPTVQAVMEATRATADEDGDDFYSLRYDQVSDNRHTIIDFETDSPDDYKYCISLDMMHSQSDRIVTLPENEIKRVMKLLHEVASPETASAAAARKLVKAIASGAADEFELRRATLIDVGYVIDLYNETIDKTIVYRTNVADVEVDRVAIGIAEDTPIGLGTMSLDTDSTDYDKISLACDLVQQTSRRHEQD